MQLAVDLPQNGKPPRPDLGLGRIDYTQLVDKKVEEGSDIARAYEYTRTTNAHALRLLCSRTLMQKSQCCCLQEQATRMQVYRHIPTDS
jgi:hypothetical protein